MKKTIFSLMLIALLFISACTNQESTIKITDFDSCVQAGNPIMESYPRQCSNNGETFIEELSQKEICENINQGKWIQDAKECENISKKTCEDMKGKFIECGSACRNQPDSQICTMQCVSYCDLNENQENQIQDTNIENKILDNYGNIVPKNCNNWYDGCNNCMLNENGILACTLMYCENPQEAYCKD